MATKKKAKKKSKPAAKARPKKAAKKSAPAPKKAAAPKGFHLSSHAPSLTVNDIAQTMAWYVDTLGFAVKQRWEREGVLRGAELVAGDVNIYVGQDDWLKGRDRIKGQGLRIYWYTNQDIDAMAAAIKAKGGSLESEPKDEYGTRSFNLVDPTGYLITIAREF
jgi:uncharacterized glyoxalase superfamily protein PhnB